MDDMQKFWENMTKPDWRVVYGDVDLSRFTTEQQEALKNGRDRGLPYQLYANKDWTVSEMEEYREILAKSALAGWTQGKSPVEAIKEAYEKEAATPGYKNRFNYENHPDLVCYLPENWDEFVDGKGWTGNDFLTFNLKPVATYNPNILNVTEETWHARALDCLRGEVAQYDAYLRGEVYGMKFYDGRTEIEATWGFYETEDQDIRKDIFADELSDWCDDLIDKMANAAYEPEPEGDFDIDAFFEENDFPELRDKIRQEVCDYIKTDAATAQVYPYGMTPDDILANKNGVLDGIVADLYDEHMDPDKASIHNAIEGLAGKSREVQPKISAADLEPGKDYTESELLAILKKKPSLSDQIAGASARQASQADNKTQPGHEQGR